MDKKYLKILELIRLAGSYEGALKSISFQIENEYPELSKKIIDMLNEKMLDKIIGIDGEEVFKEIE